MYCFEFFRDLLNEYVTVCKSLKLFFQEYKMLYIFLIYLAKYVAVCKSLRFLKSKYCFFLCQVEINFSKVYKSKATFAKKEWIS